MYQWIGAIFPVMMYVLIGYLFGALPIADRISRRKGIDIFNSGTRMAGAANVRKSVGHYTAGIVLLGDMAKGVMAIVSARIVGIENGWLVLVGLAAILGHWNSIFSGFRGGDGLATLGGVFVGLFPIPGIVACIVASIVALGAQRASYTSLLSIVFGYFTLMIFYWIYDLNGIHLIGCGVLSVLVFLHAVNSNLRRRKYQSLTNIQDSVITTDQAKPN